MKHVMKWTKERIEEISAGYDLDGGGYSFEEIDLDGVSGALQWDDPDPDYVPWVRDVEMAASDIPGYGFSSWDCPVYVFAPFDHQVTWPAIWTDDDGDRFLLRGSGLLLDTDHECYCEPEHRKETECGESSCGRPGCIDGYLESAGGSWALYTMETDAECFAELLKEAAELGRAAGQNAAEWWEQDVIGGRVSSRVDTREVARYILQGMEDGDPEFLDSLPWPNLSGEWAGDPTPASLYAELGIEAEQDSDDGALCTAWEDAASEAVVREVERLCREAPC